MRLQSIGGSRIRPKCTLTEDSETRTWKDWRSSRDDLRSADRGCMSKGKQMSTRYTVISLAFLFLSSGYSLAQTVDPGLIRVGDRWSYEVKDSLTGDLRPGMT